MKTRIILIAVLVLLAFVSYFAYDFYIIQGGPEEKTMSINQCTVTYTHYITDNQYQFNKSHGHVLNNELSLIAAKMSMGDCLCEKYLNSNSEKDSIEIVNILLSGEYYKAKNLSCVQIEDFRGDTVSIRSLCKNKQKYFGGICID